MQYSNSAKASEGAITRRVVTAGPEQPRQPGAPAPVRASHGDLLQNLVQFARRLQNAGMLVTPDEAVDGLRALEHIDMGDRQEFYLTLRSVFTSRAEDLPTFDHVFSEFWRYVPTAPDEMPLNTPTGVIVAFFASLTGFAVIWYIWWLAILGLIGSFAVLVWYSWRDEHEHIIPAEEVARLERERRRIRSEQIATWPRPA